jgi:hypothetical protein
MALDSRYRWNDDFDALRDALVVLAAIEHADDRIHTVVRAYSKRNGDALAIAGDSKAWQQVIAARSTLGECLQTFAVRDDAINELCGGCRKPAG